MMSTPNNCMISVIPLSMASRLDGRFGGGFDGRFGGGFGGDNLVLKFWCCPNKALSRLRVARC